MQIPHEARAAQRLATNPLVNIWVAANAGSGKTHVLTERVLRLLLSGTPASAILCLTYTTSAATVMKQRIFANLSKWSALSDADLIEVLRELLGRAPNISEMNIARQLFIKLLDDPTGLRIQTIHAFCSNIITKFPLETGLPSFVRLDEVALKELTIDTANHVLAKANGSGNIELRNALEYVLANLGWGNLRDLLEEASFEANKMLWGENNRDWANFSQFLELEEQDEAKAILADLYAYLTTEKMKAIRNAFQNHSRSNSSFLSSLTEIETALLSQNNDLPSLLSRLEGVVYTAAGEIRKITGIFKNSINKDSELPAAFESIQNKLIAAINKLKALVLLELNKHVALIIDEFLAEFLPKKRQLGLLSYNDLIMHLLYLLHNCQVAWVHCKLDSSIDHILVDEAQDISLEQWQIVQKLANEFFSGSGQREVTRTIFAVGDEKQSIYGFQGAYPEGFRESSQYFSKAAQAAEQEFEHVKLNFSFRSSASILTAVDNIFADPQHAAGLTALSDEIKHAPIRQGWPGEVDIWELKTPEKEGEQAKKQEKKSVGEERQRLAQQIAAVINHWLQNGEVLKSTGRAIRAGDILILVRSRQDMVQSLVTNLGYYNIATAGHDRINLLEHIAIQDLLALTRFALQPADSLSLAAVLKSPLFGLNEDELFLLAHAREEDTSLWASLQAAAAKSADYGAIKDRLHFYRNLATSLGVFEFYSRVLDQYGGRQKYVDIFGSQAGEVLDIFLNKVLIYEKNNIPSLFNFVEDFGAEDEAIKIELDQNKDAVRIMTIHSAKGLEAPIVFLIDPGEDNHKKSSAFKIYNLDKVITDKQSSALEAGDDCLRPASYFCFNRNFKLKNIESYFKLLDNKAKEESKRLLYVGATRAEDRLIVCSYKIDGAGSKSWLNMVHSSLKESCAQPNDYPTSQSWVVHRFIDEKTLPVDDASNIAKPIISAPSQAMPALAVELTQKMPVEKNALPIIFPSTTSLVNELNNNTIAQVSSPLALVEEKADVMVAAVRRGAIVHKLLQYLPDIQPSERYKIAKAYLKNIGGVSDKDKELIIASIEKLLADPKLAFLWEGKSKAEVTIMGRLKIAGQDRKISGVADRLIIKANEILVVDYKTGAGPKHVDTIALTHKLQLSLYSALLQANYPHHKVRPILIYTNNCSVFELPESVVGQIWEQLKLDTRVTILSDVG